ncbi:MAG: SDR family NAD(P)-dependent oxidoreductase [Candidatus Nanopelagicales bacterium]
MRLPLLDLELDNPLRNPEVDAAGTRVLITGASGTFGRAITAELTRRGAQVVGLDLAPREDDLVPVIASDLASDESVAAAVPEAIERLGGGLEILINNAGISAPTPAEFPPTDAVMAQLQINLLGTWRVSAACVQSLVASRGRVVMVASRMAVMQLPLAAAYGVSKRAMVGYADALRLELHPFVGVSCVYPSQVRSPIHDSVKAAGLSLEGMSVYESLDGVVAAVVRAALSEKVIRDVSTTRRGRMEFLMARHNPEFVDRKIARTLAERVRSGAFDRAELARGVVARLGGDGT